MKYFFVFALLVFSQPSLRAQDGVHIRILLRDYKYDTIWLGNSYGRKAVLQTAVQKTAKDTFDIKLDKPLPEGEYAIAFRPYSGNKKQYFNVMIPDGTRHLEVEASAVSSIKQPVFLDSPENTAYYAYREHLNQLRETRNDKNNDWRVLRDEPSLIQLEEADLALEQYQTAFIQEHPASLTAKIAGTMRYTTPPPSKKKMNWQQRADYRQQWYKAHFLDGVDIASESFWHSPEALDWLDQFTFKQSLPGPDSARWYAEDVLRRLQPNQEAFQYYFNYMLNSYESMSRFYFDEMYLYLVHQYVEQGKTPWYSPDEIIEKTDKTKNMERLLEGQKVPDVTFYTEKEEPTAIFDIKSPYTLLIFFQPDCSHCKKETNLVKHLYDKYRDKGLKVVMICGKPTDQLTMCWQFQKDFTLPDDWVLLADGKAHSRYRSLFNLQSYPKMFLLDKDKTILFRRSGEATEVELDKVFSDFIIK